MDVISEAFKSYTKKPSLFVYPPLLQWIFTIVITTFFIGIILLINGSILKTQPSIYKITLIGLITVFLLIIFAGFKASLYNGFYTAISERRERFDEYLNYASKKAVPFFIITFIKFFIMLILGIPVYVLYHYNPELFSSQIIKVSVVVIYVFLYWIISYLFKMSQLIVIIKNYSTKHIFSSIRESIKITIKRFFVFFPLYFLESIIIILGLIPILNLLIHFFAYPLVISSYIFAYKRESTKIGETGKKHKKRFKKSSRRYKRKK